MARLLGKNLAEFFIICVSLMKSCYATKVINSYCSGVYLKALMFLDLDYCTMKILIQNELECYAIQSNGHVLT